MMGRGRCWARGPALNTQSRGGSHVERDKFSDKKCQAVGLGGVSIVQEFLNIWDDLSKHYGEVVTDSYKLKAGHAVKHGTAWKEKKVDKSDTEKISKKRSFMRLNRGSRNSYLVNNELVKISTDNTERGNKADEEELVSPDQKIMLLPDLTIKAASGDHLEDIDKVDEKVVDTNMSGDCLSFKDLVDVLDTSGVHVTNLPGDGNRQVGKLDKARARQPTLKTKKRRKKFKPPLVPSATLPVLASITEEDSAIVSVQGSSWLGLGTLFREAFREYEEQSVVIEDNIEAVLRDENHNEPESLNYKNTKQKIDETIPRGDKDDTVLKVISDEENMLIEDVTTEVVIEEGDEYGSVPSMCQDEAASRRDVDGDGEVIIFGGHDVALVEGDDDKKVLSEDGHDESLVVKGADVQSGPSDENVDGDESSQALLGDDDTVPTGSPTNQVVSSIDLNNNCLKFSPSLATIIDVDEDDNSDEDDLASPAVTTVVIKHPLEHRWTFWYFYPDRNRTWEENLRTIQTVSTIEDFWAVQNWIEPPSSLQPGADYSLFKAGISPDWEDTANRKGGRWVVNTSRQEVDRDWVEVIMGMVGQQFGEKQDMQVNGAVVSTRNRGDKVAVWVREVVESDTVGTMMNMMLGRVGVFKVHKKQMGR